MSGDEFQVPGHCCLPVASAAGPLRTFVAFAAICLAAAALPSAAFAQGERGFGLAGTWSANFVDEFGRRQSCSIELSATGSLLGGNLATPRGCGATLISVSRWQPRRGGVTLNDGSGRPLAELRRERGRLVGRTNAGRMIWLSAPARGDGHAGGFGDLTDADEVEPGPRRRGCAVYYGQSDRCAEDRDISAPRLRPGEVAHVRIVYPANLRQYPSLDAPSLGLVPLNACIAAEACERQADGAEWCRMNHAGRTGYIVKLFARDGRRQILYSNRCAP